MLKQNIYQNLDRYLHTLTLEIQKNYLGICMKKERDMYDATFVYKEIKIKGKKERESRGHRDR